MRLKARLAKELTLVDAASVPDPSKLVNASLEGKTRRAIDVRVDDQIDATALKALVRFTVALDKSSAKR